jgi:MFS family permease
LPHPDPAHVALKFRGKFTRVFICNIILGGADAPIAGAVLVNCFGWRSLFASTASAAVLAGGLVLLVLPSFGHLPPDERMAERHYEAYLGFALGQAALQVVFARSEFEHVSESPLLIGLLIAGMTSLIWFGYHQWHHPHPMIHLHVLRHYGFQVGMVLYLVYYYISTSLTYLIPRFMEGGLEYTVLFTGAFTGTTAMVTDMLLFAYLHYSARIKQVRLLMIPGLTVAGLISWWLAKLSPSAGPAALPCPFLLCGLLVLLIVAPMAKGIFGYPTFRQRDKRMQFIALDDLHRCLQPLHHAVGKGLAGVAHLAVVLDGSETKIVDLWIRTPGGTAGD